MDYMRFFSKGSDSNEWHVKNPSIDRLRQIFIKANQNSANDVSVFGTLDYRHELQNVAANYQVSPKTPEKTYAVLMTERDCSNSGVKIVKSSGNTGCGCVDIRHAELVGTKDNFSKLVLRIVQRIWAGENRVRLYTAHAIIGELAVMSRLEKGIEENAIANCVLCLSKSEQNFEFPNGSSVVRMVASPNGKADDPIESQRSLVSILRPPPWYYSATAKIVRFIEAE